MTARRVLVTGGAGFIGSHLVERLLADGWTVRVLDNLSTGKRENLPAGAELLVGDVRDAAMAAAATADCSAVCHLAARVSIRASVAGFAEDAEINIMGTVRMLQAAAQAGARRFVLASSMAVYADAATSAPLPETHLLVPASAYGAAKLAAEHYVRIVAATHGMSAAVLRYFNTFGPRQAFTPYVGVVTIFTQQLLRGEVPVIFGDGEQCRDFVHVADIADGTARALVDDTPFAVYNLGTGRGTTVKVIAAELVRRLAPDVAPRYVPAHAGELRNSVADISAARAGLGYAPQRDLLASLDGIIDWNRNPGSGK